MKASLRLPELVTPRPHDRRYADQVMLCAEYYIKFKNHRPGLFPKRDPQYRKIKENLTRAMLGYAQVFESNYSGWIADKSRPGYLIRIVPPITIAAPFHLVPVIPTDDILTELERLASAVRLSHTSIICISGSNTLRRVLTHVNDVDYCEYAKVTEIDRDNRPSQLLEQQVAYCMSMRIGEIACNIPIDAKTIMSAIGALDPSKESHSTCKLEFLARLESIGATEVSNLIIVCDKNGRSASLKKSYVAQEVLVGINTWIPGKLSEPMELGRYVVGLCNDISRLVSKNETVKALKRCVSLGRICYLDEVTRPTQELLAISAADVKDELSSINRLILKMKGGPCNDFVDALEERSGAVRIELEKLRHKGELIGDEDFERQAKRLFLDVSRIVNQTSSLLKLS